MPSTIRWKGDAPFAAQVVTLQVTGYDPATTYKVTIGTITISVLGTGGTVALTAAALAALLAASTDPRFTEVTWTVLTDTITGTAVTAGYPFTAVSSVSGGAGTIGAVTTVTANSSPNDVGDARNWVGGVLPTAGDTIVAENNASAMLWRVDALSGVGTLAAFYKRRNMTGQIGLPEVNALSGTPYQEYRPKYFAIACTVTDGELGDGNGSPLVKIDNLAVATTLTLHAGNGDSQDGVGNWVWKGTHANNIVKVDSGSFSAAPFAGEVATIDSLRTDEGAVVRLGLGVTLGGGAAADPKVYVKAGTVVFASSVTTLQQDGGTVRGDSPATVPGTYTHNGGTIAWNGGDIGTYIPSPNVVIAFSPDRTRTLTTLVPMRTGMSFLDPGGTVTFGNGYRFSGCKATELTVDFGYNRVHTVT